MKPISPLEFLPGLSAQALSPVQRKLAPTAFAAWSRVRKPLAASVFLCTALAACSKSRDSKADQTDSCSPAVFDGLLQRYVIGGKVDYASLNNNKADVDSFEDYLRRIGTCDAAKLTGVSHDAFWINAYNAFNIKGVLEHWPIENIKSIDGFLDKKQWHVANLELTLNDIEYKQLIPAHKDARDHFAVVCADVGSVPLESHAYTADELETTLEKKARDFIADPHNFNVDIPTKQVRVSMLFSPEWYEKDFLVDKRFHGKKAVEYLIPYVDKSTAEFLATGDYAVSYIDWNWSLNGAISSK
jgi:hypothetical protein